LLVAAEDRVYWDTQVRDPGMAWLAQGCRGRVVGPEEAYLKRSDIHVWNVQTEEPRRLQKRAWSPRRVKYNPISDQGGSGGGRGGGGGRDGGGGGGVGQGGGTGFMAITDGKPKGKGKSKKREEQACFAWNDREEPCGSAKEGDKCVNGRAHVCSVCNEAGHRRADCRGARGKVPRK
jgi:hypothetical protein